MLAPAPVCPTWGLLLFGAMLEQPLSTRREAVPAEQAPETTPGGAKLLPAVAALLSALFAAGVVVAGQALTSRNEDRHLRFIQPWVRWLRLRYVYGDHPRSVLAAGLLLLVGGALFAIATGRQREDATIFDGTRPAFERSRVRSFATLVAAILLADGLALAVYLNVRLLTDDYSRTLIWVYLLAIACIGRGLYMLPWRAGRTIKPRVRIWEVLLLAAALAFFAIVNIRDLDSWRYAAIGDEYAFYSYARGIEQGILHANVFSQFGVYDQRPVGTSAFQALSMVAFGVDSFGWRMATVVAMAATIPAVYLLARELFDRRVAAFATLIFATSHYLFAYTHTVYDNVFAILPFTWCLALGVGGYRRASPVWLYAAGVAGGIGFYTFPTARMAPIVLLLFIATLGRKAWNPSLLAPLALGGIVAGIPLFATDKIDAISVSRDRTVFGFTPDHADVGIRILQNIPRSTLVWSYNPNPGHFVSGSFLDPVAAVLLVLGLGYGLWRVRSQSYRLMAIWLGVTLLFAGLFSPYPRAPYDRLHLALPVVSIYAGIGVSVLVSRISAIAPDPRRAGMALGVAAFIALAPLLAWLNLHRFLVDSPEVVPSSEERYVLGGLAQPRCAGTKTLAIMKEPRPLLDPALEAYGNKQNVKTRSFVDAARMSDYRSFSCIVVSEPKTAPGAPITPGSGQEVVQRMKDVFGFKQTAVVTTIAYGSQAVVLERE